MQIPLVASPSLNATQQASDDFELEFAPDGEADVVETKAGKASTRFDDNNPFRWQVSTAYLQLRGTCHRLAELKNERQALVTAAAPPQLERDKQAKLTKLDKDIQSTAAKIKDGERTLALWQSRGESYAKLERVFNSRGMRELRHAVYERETRGRQKLERQHEFADFVSTRGLAAAIYGGTMGVAAAVSLVDPKIGIFAGAVGAVSLVARAIAKKLGPHDRRLPSDGIKLLDGFGAGDNPLFVGDDGFRMKKRVVVGSETVRVRSGTPLSVGEKVRRDKYEYMTQSVTLEELTLAIEGFDPDKIQQKIDELAAKLPSSENAS